MSRRYLRSQVKLAQLERMHRLESIGTAGDIDTCVRVRS